MDLSINPESFIKDVEKNAVLYDKEHPFYEDRGLKDKLWEAIGRKHQMTGIQSQTFWLSILTRYLIALEVVTATNYIPKEKVLHSQNLKFMENNFQDFVLDALDEQLVVDITREVKQEMEKEKNDDIPKNLQMILRQVKLKKWTDTSMMNKYLSDNIPQYRKIVDEMAEVIEDIIRRREALKTKQMQRHLA